MKKRRASKKKKKPASPLKKRALRLFFFLSIIGLLLILGFTTSIYLGYWGKIPSKKELKEIKQAQATEVLSEDGELIGKYYTTDRQPIKYTQFPKHLINALIATEDSRFYEHHGVDRLSMFRVFFKSLLFQKKSSGGGSTLSQQLAKNMFPRRNYGKYGIVIHKIREIIIANRLEEAYTKEELLTQYLNIVPFSDNTFGIESAALKFFNKSTYQLKLEESAVLIGMLKTNYYYNPRLFPEASKKRRNIVLQQMYKYDYISEKTFKETKDVPLILDYQSFSHNSGTAPYFREYVKQEVQSWIKEYNKANKKQLNLYTSGLKIYTSLNAEMQRAAEKSVNKHISTLQKQLIKSYGPSAPWKRPFTDSEIFNSEPYKKLKSLGINEKQIHSRLKKSKEFEVFTWKGKEIIKGSALDSLAYYRRFLNTGFVSLEGKTGAVKTWVGGINYEHFKYDHVYQSKRQVGSTFKPFVYAEALEQGFSPCDYISNKTIIYKDLKDWTPTNSSKKEEDNKEYSLWAALSKSLNVISVKLIRQIGVNATISLAEAMGIESDLPEVPSLALGTAELNVLELAKAYTTLISDGKPVQPYSIMRIEDRAGNVLQEFTPKPSAEAVISKETTSNLLKMLQKVTDSGTASRLRYKYNLKNEIASKTGTTQNNKDGWYVGITPKIVSVCWVGADDFKVGFPSTQMGQGANSALPIFANWYKQLSSNKKFNSYTKARFKISDNEIYCPAYKEASFIDKLFSKKGKAKKQRFDRKEKPKKKGGFFKKLFGKRN